MKSRPSQPVFFTLWPSSARENKDWNKLLYSLGMFNQLAEQNVIIITYLKCLIPTLFVKFRYYTAAVAFIIVVGLLYIAKYSNPITQSSNESCVMHSSPIALQNTKSKNTCYTLVLFLFLKQAYKFCIPMHKQTNILFMRR